MLSSWKRHQHGTEVRSCGFYFADFSGGLASEFELGSSVLWKAAEPTEKSLGSDILESICLAKGMAVSINQDLNFFPEEKIMTRLLLLSSSSLTNTTWCGKNVMK